MLEQKLLKAFIKVESGGLAFDKKTGKIIIQFEPSWFKKKEPFAPSGAWSVNGVERQAKEWEAFNNAFSINANSAMQSTSIGLPQIMGFHWERLGYKSVGDMWDDFKKSEQHQIDALVRFIESDSQLLKAFNQKDWHKMAFCYNGAGYAAQAYRLGIKPYDVQLKEAYEAK
jgi:hypothetical protein